MRSPSNSILPSVPSGLLLINKPRGWRSFDVVRYFQQMTSMKKIGHSGTLDEAATGLMILAFGKDTATLNTLLNYPKTYLFRMVLGAVSDTLDAQGSKWSWSWLDLNSISEELVVAYIQERFSGSIDQVPPIYSCLKKDGKRLHEYARKGLEVSIEPRKITIHSLRLISLIKQSYHPQMLFEVTCSSGTYIRSLSRDLGACFGAKAYLADLCRSSIGPFHFSQACPPRAIKTIQDLKKRLISSQVIRQSSL
jgi:tRNA pseudouridine55 synthase